MGNSTKVMLGVYFIVGLIIGNLKYENDQLKMYLRNEDL